MTMHNCAQARKSWQKQAKKRNHLQRLLRIGGTNQHAIVGKVNAQRNASRINEFAFLVYLGVAAHDDDDIFRIVALKRTGN